jgi:HD superfamily phosphohydrolase YqeK
MLAELRTNMHSSSVKNSSKQFKMTQSSIMENISEGTFGNDVMHNLIKIIFFANYSKKTFPIDARNFVKNFN